MDTGFCDGFSKTPQISNFMKIRSVGAVLFHADGQMDRQTDTMKLIVTFCYFANAANKETNKPPLTL